MINELDSYVILEDEDMDYLYTNLGIEMPKVLALEQDGLTYTVSGTCLVIPMGEPDDPPEVYTFKFSTNELRNLHAVGWYEEKLMPIAHC